MSSILSIIAGLFVSLLAIAARIFFWNSGKNKAELKDAKKTLEDTAKGNIAAATDKYDSELQERYK